MVDRCYKATRSRSPFQGGGSGSIDCMGNSLFAPHERDGPSLFNSDGMA